MKAVVLVGGFGTRLRPLTFTTPKPLLPVGRVPMLTRIVEHLAAGGIDEVVLALGFRTEAFSAAYPDDLCAGVKLVCATEPEPLDTAGAIAFAARYAGIDDTFLAFNGDIVADLDIAAFLAAHRRNGGEASVHLTEVADPSAFGVAALDGERITQFVEKPAPGTAPSNLINGGTYVLEASVLDRVPDGKRCSIEREVFPALAAEGRLYGFATSDYWLDTGRPDTYLLANRDLVTGGRPGHHVSMLPPDCVLAGGVSVQASVIGEGCKLDADVQIVDSVLMADVQVGSNSSIRGSVIGRGALIGANAVIVDSILGDGAVVGAGETLTDARRPSVETSSA